MAASDEERAPPLRLVLLPLPLVGHIVSMVELAKRLLGLRQPRVIEITVLNFHLNLKPSDSDPPLSSYIAAVSASTPGVSFLEVPFIGPDDSSSSSISSSDSSSLASISTLLSYIELIKPLVKSAVRGLLSSSASPAPFAAAMVLDFFFVTMGDVAEELEIPAYVYYTSGAGMLGLMLYLPTLDAALPPGKDAEELHREGCTMDLPGFSATMRPLLLPDLLLCRSDLNYSAFVNTMCMQLREAKGILINTFAELQPHAMRALEQGLYTPGRPTPHIYPLGPLLHLDPKLPPGAEQHECLAWLDGQPPSSVVFLCFGSLGTFQPAQAREIAVGLERSGHRFLWAVRLPPDAGLEESLPGGFLERTRDRGLVWLGFAPQAEILGHGAVGGFVTHCGWNSCLESLWFGVPMAGWPLYAEQHFNAWEMGGGEMEVAVELRVDREVGSRATAEEVERGVRALMEGEEGGEGRKVRERATEMMEKGRRAAAEGGSSDLSLTRWVEEIVKRK